VATNVALVGLNFKCLRWSSNRKRRAKIWKQHAYQHLKMTEGYIQGRCEGSVKSRCLTWKSGPCGRFRNGTVKPRASIITTGNYVPTCNILGIHQGASIATRMPWVPRVLRGNSVQPAEIPPTNGIGGSNHESRELGSPASRANPCPKCRVP
jgi:hypothetical protein